MPNEPFQKLACIVGARPNFMKIAPILHALSDFENVQPVLIHTGQHYDKALSEVFFQELNINRPDISLGVGSGTHAKQTADVMVAVEQVLMEAQKAGEPFHRMVVVGDVNSTAAAAIAASKLHVPVAHVEAGLRSFDRKMPEEINRILTDSICDMLLVSEPSGKANLLAEGHPSENIHLVGNVMIDTLMKQLDRAKQSPILDELSLSPGEYGVVTLHRPANVDKAPVLSALVDVLIDISSQMPLVFPIHPRTMARLQEFDLLEKLECSDRIHCIGPAGYLDFLCLTSNSKLIVTDSGGLQEESTALGIPCLTMRPSTERPVTSLEGTSTLIGSDADELRRLLNEVIQGNYKCGKCPELWDGKAAQRIAKILASAV